MSLNATETGLSSSTDGPLDLYTDFTFISAYLYCRYNELIYHSHFQLKSTVDTTWPEESYGGISTDNRLRAAIDRAALPTAPRASRGPDIDTSKVPDGPPYTAFLGNLSYDVDKEDILEFFGNKKVLPLIDHHCLPTFRAVFT